MLRAKIGVKPFWALEAGLLGTSLRIHALDCIAGSNLTKFNSMVNCCRPSHSVDSRREKRAALSHYYQCHGLRRSEFPGMLFHVNILVFTNNSEISRAVAYHRVKSHADRTQPYSPTFHLPLCCTPHPKDYTYSPSLLQSIRSSKRLLQNTS